MQISAAIITFNEERNIERCLDSLKGLVDEIVVVDSLSTDGTEDICTRFGVRFVREPFRGHIEQKNFAIENCRNDWILALDADEALSEELKRSILQVKTGNGTTQAYSMNRRANYCGQWIRHGGWYPDRKVRLFRKAVARWGGMNPHDRIILQTGVITEHLNGDLLHYSYNSISEHVLKTDLFSTIAARAAFDGGRKASMGMILLNPLFAFVKKYFLKSGYLDGYNGFVIAIHSAYGKFLKYTKLRALHQQAKSAR